MLRDKIEYIVMLISAFACRNHISHSLAYRYLSDYKGIELCEQHYGILHTLSLEDGLNAISTYCRKHGGNL